MFGSWDQLSFAIAIGVCMSLMATLSLAITNGPPVHIVAGALFALTLCCTLCIIQSALWVCERKSKVNVEITPLC